MSEYFKVFKTSLDMFVKIVFWVLGALLAFRALLELESLRRLIKTAHIDLQAPDALKATTVKEHLS